MTRNFARMRAGFAIGGLLVAFSPITSAHAQASFVYNNGYGETIDPTTGIVSGGTQYTYSDEVTAPYLTLAGSTTPNPINGDQVTEGLSRIYSSFTVAQGTSVTLNTLSFDMYVKDANGTLYNPATQDPFSAAYLAVYNTDPNQFGDVSTPAGQANAQAALVGGDNTFTTNYLDTADTSFTGNYRYAPTAYNGGGPTDTTRPIFTVGINMGGLTLSAGTYFFAVSVSVDDTIAPNADAYAVIANPTDATYGQPLATNGENGIYDPNGDGTGQGVYLTDQPEYNPSNNQIILDAFPYQLIGNEDAMPEPSSIALIGLFGLSTLGGALIRRRWTKAAA